MSIQEPIEPSFNSRFQSENLIRTIKSCNDIPTLKAIAINLLELHEKKSAIASWITKRALEAEGRAMNAEMNSRKS